MSSNNEKLLMRFRLQKKMSMGVCGGGFPHTSADNIGTKLMMIVEENTDHI